jgi:predicted HAD superfamily Cof-like phosphohydrolase
MLSNTSAEQTINMTTSKTSPRQSTISQMKSNLEQAREFRNSFNVKDSKSLRSRNMQKNLIVEEFKEFLEAEGMLFRNSAALHEDAIKELSDLVYVCYQYAANMGWDLDEALRRVHQSNMSKLDEDGKPTYREDGKVLKSANYQPPTLSDLV